MTGSIVISDIDLRVQVYAVGREKSRLTTMWSVCLALSVFSTFIWGDGVNSASGVVLIARTDV